MIIFPMNHHPITLREKKIRCSAFLVIALLVGGCGEKRIDGLSASMSDDQILRVLQLDPAKLTSKRDQGMDGHSMTYSDAGHEVTIVRSIVSGVIVTRTRPVDQTKTWELGLESPDQAR